MEAVDGELQKVAKAQDLVFDVLRLVAQSMCFSEAQKLLEAGPSPEGRHDAREL